MFTLITPDSQCPLYQARPFSMSMENSCEPRLSVHITNLSNQPRCIIVYTADLKYVIANIMVSNYCVSNGLPVYPETYPIDYSPLYLLGSSILVEIIAKNRLNLNT